MGRASAGPGRGRGPVPALHLPRRTSALPAQVPRPPAWPWLLPAAWRWVNTHMPAAHLRALLVAEPTPPGLSPSQGASQSLGQPWSAGRQQGWGWVWEPRVRTSGALQASLSDQGPEGPAGPHRTRTRPFLDTVSLFQHQRPQPPWNPGPLCCTRVGCSPDGHCTWPWGKGLGTPTSAHRLQAWCRPPHSDGPLRHWLWAGPASGFCPKTRTASTR